MARGLYCYVVPDGVFHGGCSPGTLVVNPLSKTIRLLLMVLVGCYLVGIFFLSPSWWVRGVLIGLLILVVIRYMSSRNSNGKDEEEW